MPRYDYPTKTNKPWLLELPKGELPIEIDGFVYTAKNIYNSENRQLLLEKAVDYFLNHPFENEELSETYIKRQLLKLRKANESSVLKNSNIYNTSRLCLDVCRYFCKDTFWGVSTLDRPSINECFKDKDILTKVLQNRMGWCTTTEKLKGNDIGEQTYIFGINAKAVVKGLHSSMLSGNTSNFKPLVAKYILKNFGGKSVLDLSAGWVARAMAAWSLDMDYIGIDPLTSSAVNNLFKFLNYDKGTCYNSGSESFDYSQINTVDSIIVCPPYYKLEQYSIGQDTQSTEKFPVYEDWLNNYWKVSVERSTKKLNKNGKFILIMVETLDKYNLLSDMQKIIEDTGLKLVQDIPYKTTKSHLTNKRKNGESSKNTEHVLVFSF